MSLWVSVVIAVVLVVGVVVAPAVEVEIVCSRTAAITYRGKGSFNIQQTLES